MQKFYLLSVIVLLMQCMCHGFHIKNHGVKHGTFWQRGYHKSALMQRRQQLQQQQQCLQLAAVRFDSDSSEPRSTEVDTQIENGEEEELDEEEAVDGEEEEEDFDESSIDTADSDEAAAAAEVDPMVVAIAEYEKKLAGQLASLESTLKSERFSLIRQKDKLSESGKNGFFMVQAQVNEFAKKKTEEQKLRVERSKRDFVEKMLPFVDEFRNASTVAAPAQTEREETMHKSFESLLNNVIAVFEKFGYTEFDAEEGAKIDPITQEIVFLVEQEDTEPNVVLKSARRGLKSANGSIVRKAQVVVSVAPTAETVVEEEDEEGDEGEIEDDEGDEDAPTEED